MSPPRSGPAAGLTCAMVLCCCLGTAMGAAEGKGEATPERDASAVGAADARLFAARGGAGCPNAIVCENELPGTPPAVWDVPPNQLSDAIEGFADDASVVQGGTINFKIDTPATSYVIDIYRLGWYGGDGAREVATVEPSAALPQTQPPCLQDSTTGETDCGDWGVSASWAVPATAVSGVYVANLVRTDGVTGVNQIVFVVRDDADPTDLVFQTDDETEAAYNDWGGNSLYHGTWGPGVNHRAFAVSYNRPSTDRQGADTAPVFSSEYPMIRFLERNGYDVSYIAGVDTDRYGATLLPMHRVFLSVGHDEYVSGGQRANIQGALAHGVSLGFFSGDELAWKTRFETSLDPSATPYRTLVCYKEPSATDPSGIWTGRWGDRSARPVGSSGQPPNALSGTQHLVVNPTRSAYPLQVPYADSRLRFWRGTSVAQLQAGQTAALGTGIIGYEWDTDPHDWSRPAGLFDMSYTPKSAMFGGASPIAHQITEYRAPGGAMVFGAGTVQWSWGLDGTHDRGPSTPSPAMQQATVNLLADMGAQPATLMTGLVAATPSDDHIPPVSAISDPSPGSSVPVGSPVNVSGSATDLGGGVVAEVDVSTDGGKSWRPANGDGPWSYSWTPRVVGNYNLEVRAVDDSGNLQAPGPPVSVQVTPAA